MTNRHNPWDLKQMQSLPLDAKIRMTKLRIRAWYDSWKRYEIYNTLTGKTRYVTATEEPVLKDNEYIENTESGWVYIGFSGGKDSTVLKHLVDSMYDDVPAVFVNTGLEYPEIQRFVTDIKSGKYDCFNSDVEIVRPSMRFDEVLKTYGYPAVSKEVSRKIYEGRRATLNGNPDNYASRQFEGTYVSKNGKPNGYSIEKWKPLYELTEIPISHMCCDVMKKKPSKQYERETGRVPFLGTMAVESALRRQNWIKNGCNAFETARPTSQPLSFWTDQDILEYIQKFNVPYASVYGDIVSDGDTLKTTGCNRTGCIFCMFGAHLDKGENKFQMLKKTHPRQYEYCIGGGEMVDGKWQPSKEGLGLGKVLDILHIKYD